MTDHSDQAPPASPQADLYAWTGIFLTDGRMISVAWLCGWPGAVASPAPAGGCRRGVATCDRPDPHACAVHGELHRLAGPATTGGAG